MKGTHIKRRMTSTTLSKPTGSAGLGALIAAVLSSRACAGMAKYMDAALPTRRAAAAAPFDDRAAVAAVPAHAVARGLWQRAGATL